MGDRGGSTVVHGLKVVYEGQDVAVTHGDFLQDGDLIAYLNINLISTDLAF